MTLRLPLGITVAIAMAVPAWAQNIRTFPGAMTRVEGQQLLDRVCANGGKGCIKQPTGSARGVQPFVVGGGAILGLGSPNVPIPGVRTPLVVGPQAGPGIGTAYVPTVSGASIFAGKFSLAYTNPMDRVVAITFDVAGAGQLCTGIVMDPNHVLTAGHCGCGDAGSYQVHFADQTSEGPSQRTKAPILLDPRACASPRYQTGHDLALLELQSRIRCAPAVPPTGQAPIADDQLMGSFADCRSPPLQSNLTIPAETFGFPAAKFWDLQSKLRVGQRLLVAGFGYTNGGAIGLRMQDLIPIASVACTEPTLASVCAPYAEMILAEAVGTANRDDTCEGDSGGPVFLAEAGAYSLIALTSRAAPGVQDDTAHQCGGGGIYTLIGRNSVQHWLTANGVGPALLLPPPITNPTPPPIINPTRTPG
jgi:Trypsin